MENTLKKKLLEEYNNLPDLPYGETIKISNLGKIYILDNEPVKIYTSNFKTYKVKPELWNILAYIIDLIFIKCCNKEYNIPCSIYIDKDDKWVSEIIKIVRYKYFINHDYYINMGFF